MFLTIMWDEDGSVDIFRVSKKLEELMKDEKFDVEEYIGEKFDWSGWHNHCTWCINDGAKVRKNRRNI